MKKQSLVLMLLGLIFTVFVVPVAYADAPVEGRVGRAELRFLEGMIDHHQMALDMAADCLAKAETEAVRTLCQNIIDAQSREILTMRGWLLGWYGIDYEPSSMLHAEQETEAASGGMSLMQGGMMGMMSNMSQMMSGMSGMMEMMMGMGMMGEGGMGMAGAEAQMGPMSDMGMMQTMQIMSVMGLTVGELLEQTADLDESTPLLDVFNQLIAEEGTQPDPDVVMPMMGSMTQGQMMGMFAEMHNLTIGDMHEMMGHLDAGANATVMEMMQHHMSVMAGGSEAQAAEEADHEAHHPEGENAATAEPADASEHSSGNHAGTEHDTAAANPGHSDPTMTMGMFAGLHALTGVEYEIAWLEAMIDHHDDAIHMAERILERAPESSGHNEIREIAQNIISDQTAEIEAMEALITEMTP